jgi:hypothetical protein
MQDRRKDRGPDRLWRQDYPVGGDLGPDFVQGITDDDDPRLLGKSLNLGQEIFAPSIGQAQGQQDGIHLLTQLA